MKTCNLCKELKSEDNFYKSLGRIRLQCKVCLGRKQAAGRFGLSYEQLLAMYEEQNYACRLCERVVELHIDHDHACCPRLNNQSKSCGKCVRGLLCGPCNQGLGFLRDDVEILRKAIEYLGN